MAADQESRGEQHGGGRKNKQRELKTSEFHGKLS
jgi:hypothetical protein